MGSNKRYDEAFCKLQQNTLRDDHISTFDIKLLIKILQIGCGLAPRNDKAWRAPQGKDSWTYKFTGAETLEFLLGIMKNMYNYLSNDYKPILDKEEHFDKLQQLLTVTIEASSNRALEFNKIIPSEEKNAIIDKVQKIISNIKTYL